MYGQLEVKHLFRLMLLIVQSLNIKVSPGVSQIVGKFLN